MEEGFSYDHDHGVYHHIGLAIDSTYVRFISPFDT